jgi:hypothetical protein
VKLILKGPLHALFHQHGFKTSGPNRIPFTRRAVRGDAKGKREALYAKKGVTVPARPIFAMPIEARREVKLVPSPEALGLVRINLED